MVQGDDEGVAELGEDPFFHLDLIVNVGVASLDVIDLLLLDNLDGEDLAGLLVLRLDDPREVPCAELAEELKFFDAGFAAIGLEIEEVMSRGDEQR